MKFLREELFNTPDWLINKELFNKFEHAGVLERIRSTQVRTLNNLLDFGRLQRLSENETLNGNEDYTLLEMMTDLRNAVWSELSSGRSTDTYRRNLQRAYIDRIEYLMTKDQPNLPANFRRFVTRTKVEVSQSDIRAIVRAQLNILRGQLRDAGGNTLTRYHYQDALERIENILDPK